MTQSNKLKQRVRERAKRTGESYTAARRHVVADMEKARTKQTALAAEKARKSTPKGAVSEERCRDETGHGFDHWFAVLDRFGAPSKGHTEAARHLRTDHGVSPWYSQGITVSYERARGLRQLGQSCAGDFQASASRVLAVSLDVAKDAVVRKPNRERWLPRDNPAADGLRDALESTRFKSGDDVHRIRYHSALGTVDVRITAKPDGRSTVWVQESKLGTADDLEAQRAAWRATLDALRDHLK